MTEEPSRPPEKTHFFGKIARGIRSLWTSKAAQDKKQNSKETESELEAQGSNPMLPPILFDKNDCKLDIVIPPNAARIPGTHSLDPRTRKANHQADALMKAFENSNKMLPAIEPDNATFINTTRGHKCFDNYLLLSEHISET